MRSDYRYIFSGPYLTCPQCGKPKKYRDMYDTATAQPVAAGECGACFSCGYDYKVRDYFIDHPEARNEARSADWQPLPPPPVTYIDRHHVTDYMTTDLTKGNLLAYLMPILGKDVMLPVLRKYGVGVDVDGSMRWPQIDENRNVREIKIQQHNRFNGHREGLPTHTVHKTLRDKGEIDPESTQEQCLFGQHLLARVDENTIVAITESEKTAIIFAILYPQVIWLATGGEGNFGLIIKAQKILRHCGAVIIYPDAGSQTKWKEASRQLQLNNVEFSDLCSGHPHNVDLADLLIYEYLSTHKQPQQQQLNFEEPVPAKASIKSAKIVSLFRQSYINPLEAMTQQEINEIFDFDRVQKAMVSPVPF